MDIEETLRKHRDELLRMPGVVGVGIGADPEGEGRVILIMVNRDPRLAGPLPQAIDGHRLVIQEAGEVSAL